MIISASRRTDIPAFYPEWFMNRLQAGFCVAVNPFNPAQRSLISLLPGEVDCIVFWSKNPKPLIPRLDEIDERGFRYYFLFTLNDYPAIIEANVPPLDARVRTFRELADRIGKGRVVWRYDPILVSSRMDSSFHRAAFERLAIALNGATECCVVSVADFYARTEKRLATIEQSTGDRFQRNPFGDAGFAGLIRDMVSIAHSNDIGLQSCAESGLGALGVKAGKCIDDGLIRREFGIEACTRKDAGQRSECACVESRDIGHTDTCLHGCAYCYATRSHEAAVQHSDRHDPGGESMTEPATAV